MKTSSFSRQALGATAWFALLSAGTAAAAVLPNEQCVKLLYDAAVASAGSAVSDLAAGDLDGDGDVDLVSADAAAGVVRILSNDGAGGFSERSVAVAGAPSALAIADLDADADVDLVIGRESGLTLLRNDGAGNFTPGAAVIFPALDLGPVDVAAADVDGDGRLDVVVGLGHHSLPNGSYTGGLAVAFGDGAGGLALGPTHALALPAFRVVVADFDGDGEVDAAELGGYVSATTVNVAFGAGDGTFANGSASYAAGAYAGALAAGDLDGDGDVDLATGSKYYLGILANDGAGGFSAGQHLNPGYYVKGIATGDLDRDGDLDLLATSGSSSAIRLLTNDGSATFASGASVPASVQCYAVLLADTSGDGYPDAWAGDVVNGLLSSGTSHCVVARYGRAKPSSLGCLPSLTATGAPSAAGADFVVSAQHELTGQPALVLAGLGPQSLPALGGLLLVAPPWALIPSATSGGSGNPLLCDGTVTLPIPGAALGAAGVGTVVYLQVLAADTGSGDGTMASLSDGLWFEVVP